MGWDTKSKGLSGGAVVKNLPANDGNARNAGSIPRSERSPAEGHERGRELGLGKEKGDSGVKKKKTFGGFCLLDNYILLAGFCKTRSFVAATTVSEDYGWYNMSKQG